MPTEKEIIQNMEKCPHFDSCNQNLCPLDLELNLRTGNQSDKCRWMKDPSLKKIGDKEFISGGRVMPDGILNFVPQRNLERINKVSQGRWKEIKKNK
jgi:hypothetical protein